MTLPVDFTFSQSNLQDYRDCPYRFYLKYILHTRWPALVVEDALEFERLSQSGARFHRLVQQYLLGVPEDRLTAMAASDPNPDLTSWWNNFLMTIPPFLKGDRFVETTLAASLGGYRLLAKYDLILIQPEKHMIIFDWKTSQKQPRKEWLEERIQTRLYRFLMACSANELEVQLQPAPEDMEMRYWFAPLPGPPISLPYDFDAFQEDRQYFADLIEEIKEKSLHSYPRTADETRCRFCIYRAHCNRGITGGDLEEMEALDQQPDAFETLLDFDQIGEIEF